MTSDTDQFAAMDEFAEWAVEHATELAELDRKPLDFWTAFARGGFDTPMETTK